MGTEWRAAARTEEGADFFCRRRLSANDADRPCSRPEFFGNATHRCAGVGAGERDAGEGDGLERCAWKESQAGSGSEWPGANGFRDRSGKGFQYLLAAT